jgi:hypothetical protein
VQVERNEVQDNGKVWKGFKSPREGKPGVGGPGMRSGSEYHFNI